MRRPAQPPLSRWRFAVMPDTAMRERTPHFPAMLTVRLDRSVMEFVVSQIMVAIAASAEEVDIDLFGALEEKV
jgi:hypothetical protein